MKNAWYIIKGYAEDGITFCVRDSKVEAKLQLEYYKNVLKLKNCEIVEK